MIVLGNIGALAIPLAGCGLESGLRAVYFEAAVGMAAYKLGAGGLPGGAASDQVAGEDGFFRHLTAA